MSLIPPPAANEPTAAPLVLTPPKPADKVVEPDAAPSMLTPIPEERKLEISKQADEFTTNLMKFTPNSPEYKQSIKDLSVLAQKTIRSTAAAPSRLLDRSQTSVAGAKRQGDPATISVAKDLTKLRGLVEDLTPNQAALTGPAKILGFIPGGNKLRHYFERYQSAQVQLNAIINALMKSQDELRIDNAELEQQQRDLWDDMGKLNEYATLAKDLDAQLVQKIDALRTAGNIEGAKALENDVLFVVRQRHQDILTQLTVAIQGYLAMGIVQKNNEELIKGVDRAQNVTVTALRTAVAVAEALEDQRLVLDQIDALRDTTGRTILATSEMLNQQTARVQKQAADPAIELNVLSKAFDNIFATLDSIDTFKTQANDAMDKTIGALETQIARAKPVLDRVQASDQNAQDKPALSR